MSKDLHPLLDDLEPDLHEPMGDDPDKLAIYDILIAQEYDELMLPKPYKAAYYISRTQGLGC